MSRTPDQTREEGLDALRERLGPADMIRFLQQFEHGSGDYAKGRRESWTNSHSSNSERNGIIGRRNATGRREAQSCVADACDTGMQSVQILSRISRHV